MTQNNPDRRALNIVLAGVLAFGLLGPGQVGAGLPFFNGNGDVVIAPGSRFIDGLGTLIPVPTANDMALRFRDGPRYDPRNLVIIDDPRINGYARKAESIVDDLLRSYTKGPKPQHVPVYIVESDDPNCMVTPVNDGTEDTADSSLGIFGFLKKAQQAVAGNASSSASASSAAPESTTAQPKQLELYCTTAFLENVASRDDSDDEMNFILAHELSHILLGHWEREEKLQRQSEEIAALVTDGMLLSAVVNSKYTRSGNQIIMTPTPEMSKNISQLFLADVAMQEFTNVVQGPHWQLIQERQADILGLDLLQEAGMSRGGAPELLAGEKALEEQRRKSEPPFVQSFLGSTAALAFIDFNQSNAQSHNARGQLSTQVLYMLYAKWRDSSITHVHDNADKRMQTISKYEQDHPETHAQSSTGKAFFGKFSQDYAPIRADEDLEKDISVHGCDSLSGDSLKTIDALKHSKTRNQKEDYDLANYYICKSQWSDAVVPAKAAAEGKSRTPYYYLQYITVLQNTKALAESLAVIDEASVKAPPGNQYVIQKIQSLLALKRQADAEAAAKACRDSENLDMGSQCMALVGLSLDGSPLPKDDGGDTSSSSSSSAGGGSGFGSMMSGLFKPKDASAANAGMSSSSASAASSSSSPSPAATGHATTKTKKP